jgi:exonuclease I
VQVSHIAEISRCHIPQVCTHKTDVVIVGLVPRQHIIVVKPLAAHVALGVASSPRVVITLVVVLRQLLRRIHLQVRPELFSARDAYLTQQRAMSVQEMSLDPGNIVAPRKHLRQSHDDIILHSVIVDRLNIDRWTFSYLSASWTPEII